jgi:alpha-galactosidase/6-phospho-beta-glucosidase family protein
MENVKNQRMDKKAREKEKSKDPYSTKHVRIVEAMWETKKKKVAETTKK